MRISCPGQSTNETCRIRRNWPPHPGRSHGNTSSLLEPAERKRSGLGHFSLSHSNIYLKYLCIKEMINTAWYSSV